MRSQVYARKLVIYSASTYFVILVVYMYISIWLRMRALGYSKLSYLLGLTRSMNDEVITDSSRRRSDRRVLQLSPKAGTLVSLFQQQAAINPDAIAAICLDHRISYGDLHSKSKVLASLLLQRGVRVGQLVPLCVERGLDMLVGIWGILMAGAAYVPLDPDYPAARLQLIVANTGANLIVAHSACVTKLRGENAHNQDSELLLDTVDLENTNRNNVELPAVAGNDLAYVIYTSGTTGIPKGVMIEHKSIVARLKTLVKLYGLSADDVCIHYRSFAYDASLEELVLPMLSGSKVIIAEPGIEHNLIERLLRLISDHGVTHVNLTPSLLPLFLKYIKANTCHQQYISLRRVIAGGEELLVGTVREFYKLFNISLYHMYGPTENTIDSICWLCDKNHKLERIPIGIPLDHVDAYILNENFENLLGENQGELCLGGIGLARGYLNDSRLTEEKFVYVKINEKETRLYRSGDFVKRLANGGYVFIGRNDHQVQIRGFRVELEEVNIAISKYSQVVSSHVSACDDGIGGKLLAAYLVCHDKNKFDLSGFKHFLSKRLPRHMLPARVLLLNNIPLMPNGKTDAMRLSNDFHYRDCYERQTKYVAPNNSVEEAMVGIMSDILNIPADHVGMHDNFFNLGGNSLTAMEMVGRINNDFSCSLSSSFLFEQPTVKQIASSVMNALKSTAKKSNGAELSTEKCYPLSTSQEQIWMHQQGAAEANLYNEPLVVTLYIAVDVAVMEKSLNYLFRRHDVLRSRLAEKNGKPYQKYETYKPVSLRFRDVSALRADNRDKVIAGLANQLLLTSFDMSNDCLIRFLLIKKDDNLFKMYISAHHCITDAVTMFQIIIPELKKTYEALLQNEPPELPDIPARCIDYIESQQLYKNSCQAKDDLQYWEKQLSSYNPSAYSFLGNNSLQHNYRGKVKYFHLSHDLYQGAVNLSKKCKATLFATLLAVFKILIYKYSYEKDLLIMTVIAGRTDARFMHVAGNFLNLVLLRTSIDDRLRFKDFLVVVHQTLVEAIGHQFCPMQEVIKILKRNKIKPRLFDPFQIAFVFEPQCDIAMSDWLISQEEIHTGTAKYPLSFELEEKESTIFGRVEYKSDCLDDVIVENLINNYEYLLQKVVDNSEIIIDELSCISQQESDLIVSNGVGCKTRIAHKTVIDAFEEQVRTTPNNVAVSHDGKVLTYTELNHAANQLAVYLHNLELSSEELIPVYMERGLDLIITVIAILKSGGAFTVIDSKLPVQRVSCILEDINPAVVCSQKSLTSLLPCDDDMTANVLAVDNMGIFESDCSKANCQFKLDENGLAYTVYTSGSTGKPKGVLVEHKSLVNTIVSQLKYFNVSSDDKILSVTPIGFDAFISELFVAVASGACFELAKYDNFPAPNRLIAIVNKTQATVLTLTPSVLSMLNPNDFTSLRTVVSMGERCLNAIVRKWSSQLRFINAYGPSECAICATLEVFDKDAGLTSIGRPIDNVTTYVLDDGLSPVPIGVIGELYVGGVGVARGYLHRDELTGQRFLKDHFCSDSKAKMYKTGDLVKWRLDGKLEYIGRIDDQVKISGNRVELSEVEQYLATYYNISNCAVVAKSRKSGSAILEAYLLLQNGADIELQELKDFCAKYLPDYMIPSKFYLIDKMPLTSNGKVNKELLSSDIMLNKAIDEESNMSPITSLQKRLADLWGRILDVKDIYLHDDFFDLGGHSLSVLELVSRIQDEFKAKIPTHKFCSMSSLKKMCDYIKSQDCSDDDLDSELVEQ